MKPPSCIAMAAILWCVSAVGQDAPKTPMRIRPIQVSSYAPIPEEVPWELVPMASDLSSVDDCDPDGASMVPLTKDDLRPAGFRIVYLIEGRDIVCFHSLAIDSITAPEGHDISRSPNGKRAYAVDKFPRTSADGKYCVCSLIVKQNQFGKVERLSIKGHATVMVATKREEKAIELGLATKGAKTIGPFSVAVKAAVDSCAGHPASDLLDVELTGPIKRRMALKVTEGDKDLRQLSSWDDGNESVTVLKPQSGKFMLKVLYAVQWKPVEIPLEKLAP